MTDNLKIWNQAKDVPPSAQKTIKGGRLSGLTDISPQWRYYKMTELFGPIGFGWKFTLGSQWMEEGADGSVCAFCNVNLYIKIDGEWSEPIPGTGGSMLVTKERNGMYTSDEAIKMALTDALGVAMKMLGVGAVIYSGGNDYSKYTNPNGKAATPNKNNKLATITAGASPRLRELVRSEQVHTGELIALWEAQNEDLAAVEAVLEERHLKRKRAPEPDIPFDNPSTPGMK